MKSSHIVFKIKNNLRKNLQAPILDENQKNTMFEYIGAIILVEIVIHTPTHTHTHIMIIYSSFHSKSKTFSTFGASKSVSPVDLIVFSARCSTSSVVPVVGSAGSTHVDD